MTRWAAGPKLRRMTRTRFALLGLLAEAMLCLGARAAEPLRIGSKRFTESYILAQVLAQAAAPHAPVEVKAGLGNTAIVYEALRAGASGFLLKDTPPEQLVDAIHVVARGDALLSPSITRRVIEEFVAHPPNSVRKPPPELEELTARELEMLRYLARGLSNAEIATEAFVSETTVKTHVARILMKLRIRDRVQAVVLAYETGVVQPGETSTHH